MSFGLLNYFFPLLPLLRPLFPVRYPDHPSITQSSAPIYQNTQSLIAEKNLPRAHECMHLNLQTRLLLLYIVFPYMSTFMTILPLTFGLHFSVTYNCLGHASEVLLGKKKIKKFKNCYHGNWFGKLECVVFINKFSFLPSIIVFS
jgi:hypothetical protein